MTPEPTDDVTRNVFVVCGRNASLNRAMFDFLRAIGLNPIEWSMAVAMTESGAPFIGEVLDTAFGRVQAVVVLITPDEVAYLQSSHGHGPDDAETQPAPQARPNVLFEAGMALGRHPRHTVLVEVGDLRPFSDVAGRHAIRMSNAQSARQELASRLATAGCPVNTVGTDWHDAGDFTPPLAPGQGLPLGRRVPGTSMTTPVLFDAAYHESGSKGSGTLQIINRGAEAAYDVDVALPDECSLQFFDFKTIQKIPGRGKSVSVRVFNDNKRLGGHNSPTAFDIVVTGRTDAGEEVRQEVFIDTLE